MSLEIEPSGMACGAMVRGIDLARAIDRQTVDDIRAAWLTHHVLAFPDQSLTASDLERITLYFGRFSDDPFIAPIDGHPHVIAVQRRADETGPIFAEAWHSDWSFMATPPDGTILYGIDIPPTGGDTNFANQHLAWMPSPIPQNPGGAATLRCIPRAAPILRTAFTERTTRDAA